VEGQGQGGAAPAAWHPDPYGEATHRYWDGQAWTDDLGPAEPQFGLTPIREAAGGTLALAQSIGSGNDELRDDQGRLVGYMNKPFAGEVTVYSDRGTWLLDRQGIITGKVSIRVQPPNVEIARFEWQGIGTGTNGRIIFNDGRWFDFIRGEDMDRSRLAGPEHEFVISAGSWTFLDHAGAPVVTARLTFPEGGTFTYGTGKTAGTIVADVFKDAAARRELPLLTMLGVFLVWWTISMRESVSRD
jgi:hypothetical protein